MICKVCNAENAADSVFCENCGASLTENSAVQNNAPANTAQNPGKAVGMVALITGIVALISSLILGLLGILTELIGYIPLINVIMSILSLPLGVAGVIIPVCAIASIVCGIIALKKAKSAGCKNTMGLVGMILGSSTVVTEIAIKCIIFVISAPKIITALLGIVSYIVALLGIATQSGGGGYYYG